MKPRQRLLLTFLTISLGLLLAWAAARAAPAALAARLTGGSQQPAAPTPLPDQPAANAPAISVIDGPAPSCVLPRPGTDACYLTWSYLSASASPNYMITMTVDIDNQPRARYHGFFQTSMYIPTEMLVFRVPCGVPGSSEVVGAGEDPLNWGMKYSYAVRGRDSAGLRSANYGSVVCPADQVALAAASLDGPATGKPGLVYTFTAEVAPLTATLPITYTWLADDHPPQVEVDSTGQQHGFTWENYGLKTIQLTIDNPVSSLVLSDTILVEPYRLFTPLIRRTP